MAGEERAGHRSHAGGKGGWSLVIVSSWVGFRVGLGWWLGFGLF